MCDMVVCKRHGTTAWRQEDGKLMRYDPHCGWNGCTSNPQKNFTTDLDFHRKDK